ncbi:MAG TPA: carboxypeptidase regulatory-like domain-containing protein [Terracidiphilus sp.]|nr:carboxypeptidase regulatory-like domain-containing protein [Terracidiphilus sp.]
MSPKLTFFAIVLIASLACPAFSQEFRAVLTGQVTDSSGAVIRNAKVSAIETSTGTTYSDQTSPRGVYYIPYVLPGNYTVAVEANGFKTFVQDNVLLKASQTFAQNFKLEVGSVSEKVVVTTAPPELETASGSGGTVIDARQLENVPLNGAQVYMLIGTTPGSQFTQTSFGPGVGYSGTRGWDVSSAYTLGGGVVGQNQFTLNGTNMTQQTGYGQMSSGAWDVSPNIDAIQEANVMTTTYDARYGRTSGGTVNVVTKNGTNAFHGSADEAYEGTLMNANTYQNNLTGYPRNGQVQNQFHITAGGPVKRNKLFFFFGFEGYRESLAATVLEHVPPAYLRPGYNGNAGVDFGLVGTMDPSEFPTGLPVYEPGTAYCVTGGPVTSCNDSNVAQTEFPNDTIPGSQINPIGAALLNYVPLPNIPGADNLASGNNFIGHTPDLYDYNQPMARVDFNLNNSTKMYSFFEWQKGTEYRSNNGFSGVAANGNINWVRENWVATQDFTHVFSPTLLGDFKLSFARYFTKTPDGDLAAAVDPSTVGLTMPLPATTNQKDLPEIKVGDNWNSGVIGNNTVFGNEPGAEVTNNIGLDADITKTWGSHNVHIGGSIYEFQFGNPGDIGSANGNFSFGSEFTQYDPHNTSCYQTTPSPTNSCASNAPNGSGLASLLLGYPTGGGVDWNGTIFEGQPVYAIYGQDDWRVNHRLTLNIGLRYDVQRGLRERHDHLNRGLCFTCINPITNDSTYQANIANSSNLSSWAAANVPVPSTVYGGVLFAGDNGQSRDAYDTDFSNVGPRIGFAFAADPKTVFRGGFGLMYSFGLEGGSSIGQYQSTSYISTLDNNTPTASFQSGSPFPNGLIKPEGNSLGLLTDVGQCCLQVDFPGRKIPREKLFSFGMQHEFPGATVLDLRYAANYTSKLRTFLWVNGDATLAATKAAIADPSIWSQQVPNPYYNVPSMVQGGCGTSTTVEAIDLILPLSQYCNAGGSSLVGEYNAPLGHNWYNGMEVKLTKRVHGNAEHGLSFQVAYTWSKTINGDGYQNGWPYQDPHQQHWISGNDRTHVLGVTAVWDLPFGKGAQFAPNPNAILGTIINHWSLSSVVAAQSGTPVGLDTSYYYTCSHSFVPDNGTSVRQGHWFYANKSCWQGIPTWGLSDLPGSTNELRVPRVANFDFSLLKSVPIRENLNFILRLDAFNATNSVLFGGPDTNPGDGPATYTTGAGWSGFGTVGPTQQNFPRVLQISGKITF